MPALPVPQQHRHAGPGLVRRPDRGVSALPLSQRRRRLPELQAGLLRQRHAAGLQE